MHHGAAIVGSWNRFTMSWNWKWEISQSKSLGSMQPDIPMWHRCTRFAVIRRLNSMDGILGDRNDAGLFLALTAPIFTRTMEIELSSIWFCFLSDHWGIFLLDCRLIWVSADAHSALQWSIYRVKADFKKLSNRIYMRRFSFSLDIARAIWRLSVQIIIGA